MFPLVKDARFEALADDVELALPVSPQALPLTHLIDGLSAAMVTGAPFGEHLSDLAIVLIWAAAGAVLAVRGFSWEARRG